MALELKLSQLKAYQGAQVLLDGPTAVVLLHVTGPVPEPLALTRRLGLAAAQFWPAEPVPGLEHEERGASWPHAFLACPPHDGLGAWFVALVVALQRLARDPVGAGQVMVSGPTVCRLALPWQRSTVLNGALDLALRWLQAWLEASATAELTAQTAQWLDTVRPRGLAPSTVRFAMAARRRGIPVALLPGGEILQLGWGAAARRLESTFTDGTGVLATRIARRKYQTSLWLEAGGVPVPRARQVTSFEQAQQWARELGWPVVVKPSNQDQGRGVVPGICDDALLRTAYDAAARWSPGAVLVEQHVPGDDHRMLVVGGRLVMATRRVPGGVTGDGVHTVAELLAQVNADPRRGSDKRSLLMALSLDPEGLGLLAQQALSPQAVPAAGRFVQLRRTANISTGGTAEDVTDRVHPDNCRVAERAARLLGLDIGGVDFLCPDISRSWFDVGGAVCEVNAQPGLRVHWLGAPGRDINGEIVDWLFAGATSPGRIPVAAITGTNGKTTTARMLHHIWCVAGRRAGVCTTQGIWVGDNLVTPRNLSGFPGGVLLLTDPSVEAAVIEMPRKGLIVFGHPGDYYDVSALLNVQDDHLGVDGVDSLETMARLKAGVLARTRKAVVVNAEDPLCLAMLAHAGTRRHVLVARDAASPALARQLAQGGEAVFISAHEGADWVVLAQGSAWSPLMPVAELAATLGGLLRYNETNALFAIALAHAQGLAHATIRQAMAGFVSSPTSNPGRYNFIGGFPFQVLLDNAHNPDGARGICEVARALPVTGRRWLVSLNLGSRFASHLRNAVPLLAPCFDGFILGADPKRTAKAADYAGPDPLGAMLQCFEDEMRSAGVPDTRMRTERDPAAAIRIGLAMARPGDLLVVLADPSLALSVLQPGNLNLQEISV